MAKHLSTEHLKQTIVDTSVRFGLQYSDKTIDEVLEYFKDAFFQDSNWIQFRLARKRGRIEQFNWRSEIYEPNLNCGPILEQIYEGIRKLGTMDHVTSGCGAIIAELAETYPSSGLAVDFDPVGGFTKLWHWGRYNITQLSKLKNAPQSIQQYLPIFAEQGVSALYCTGVDYTKKSMNVYFDWCEQRKYKEDSDVQHFLRQIGFSVPSEDSLASMARAACLACTFRWDSPNMERCCFYMNAWAEVSEDLEQFKVDCALPTTRNSDPFQFVACSVGPVEENFYTKLESDYFGNYSTFLSKIHTFLFATGAGK